MHIYEPYTTLQLTQPSKNNKARFEREENV